MGQHVASVVVGREAADPAVEELHELCAGIELGHEIAAHGTGDPVHQVVPGRLVAVHERLGVEPGFARAPLDAVAGQREGRAGEADHRNRIVEPRAGGPHDVHHVAERLEILQLMEPLHVGRFSKRIVDHRALPHRELKIHAHRLEDGEQIAEDDRRIDTEPVDRGDHHFRRQSRILHQPHEVNLLPHAAVFRQVAARLSHQPHGRAFHRLAAAGPHEQRLTATICWRHAVSRVQSQRGTARLGRGGIGWEDGIGHRVLGGRRKKEK